MPILPSQAWEFHSLPSRCHCDMLKDSSTGFQTRKEQSLRFDTLYYFVDGTVRVEASNLINLHLWDIVNLLCFLQTTEQCTGMKQELSQDASTSSPGHTGSVNQSHSSRQLLAIVSISLTHRKCKGCQCFCLEFRCFFLCLLGLALVKALLLSCWADIFTACLSFKENWQVF